MNKIICPKCGGPANEGAAICYTCKSILSWRKWLKLNWPVPVAWVFLVSFIIYLWIGLF